VTYQDHPAEGAKLTINLHNPPPPQTQYSTQWYCNSLEKVIWQRASHREGYPSFCPSLFCNTKDELRFWSMSQVFPSAVGSDRHSSCVTATQQARMAFASLAQVNSSLVEWSYFSLKISHDTYFTEGYGDGLGSVPSLLLCTEVPPRPRVGCREFAPAKNV